MSNSDNMDDMKLRKLGLLLVDGFSLMSYASLV